VACSRVNFSFSFNSTSKCTQGYPQRIKHKLLQNTPVYWQLELHVSAEFIGHLQGVISSDVETKNYVVTTWDNSTSILPVVDWTDAHADLSGLVRFAERRNLVSASVPSHFDWPVLTDKYSPNSTITIKCGQSVVCRRGFGVFNPPPPQNSEGRPKSCQTQHDCKNLKIAEFRTPTPKYVGKKGSKILKLPSVRNCFTLAMTNKLFVTINSLKVPKI